MLASTLACTTAADALVNYSGYVPQRLTVNSPSPRWEFHIFCACACRAAVSLSTAARLPSHRAPSLATQLLECVLTLKISHRPDGKIADELASTHDCTTAADAPVNYRLYLQQRTLKTSHHHGEN